MHPTPIGQALVVATDEGLAALQITGHLHEPRTIDGNEHLADLLDLALEQLRPV